MASKKYTFILGLMSLISSITIAQSNDAGYNWNDSSKISTKNMPQHNEFMNNQYPYPAKPRSQWEATIHGGGSAIIGDIDPRLGFGGGIAVRKALDHTFSVRVDYTGTINKGLDYRPRAGITYVSNPVRAGNISPWGNSYGAPGDVFYANYRTRTHQGNVDLIATLNNKSYYRGNPKTNIYVFGGYSLLVSDVDVNALNGNAKYPFALVSSIKPRKDIKAYLKNLLDDSYESNGFVANGNRGSIGRINDNQLIRHSASIGGGIAVKVGKSGASIGLEQRITFTFDDNLDAISIGKGNDYISYTSARLNIPFGKKSKMVAPLWWINPNNYVYNEINKPAHMKLPKVKLDDADNDGVTDQFDLEPNTPAGAPVDTHGVARDTDGDGVPDFKDKELLTPAKCFPVNTDGIGNCPEPSCCRELREKIDNMKTTVTNEKTCEVGNLPSVQFRAGSSRLTKDAEAILASVASNINANPNCKIKVTGYGASDKSSQQMSWDRVNAVITYLVEKQGISEQRFVFAYGRDGDVNTIDLMGTIEDGPNTVPAPHPNLRKRN